MEIIHPLSGQRTVGNPTGSVGESHNPPKAANQSSGQPSSSDAASESNPSSDGIALLNGVQHRYLYPHGDESKYLLLFWGM